MHQPLSVGERALLTYLDTNLPWNIKYKEGQPLKDYNGWLIFVQPYLNGARPDIIVFNPHIGVVVIEVKDWNLANYCWKEEKPKVRRLYVKSKSGKDIKIKSPITQVIHYKEKIIGQLVPLIGERADKEKAAYGLIKTAVYFHNEKTKSVQDFFREKVNNYKIFPEVGRDLLQNKEDVNKIIPDCVFSNNKYWDKSWNEELLFWFKPPYHSIEQGTVLTLRGEQAKIAEPKPDHQRAR